MLPYFRKSGRHWDRSANPIQHWFKGPVYTTFISTSDPERKYPLREPLRAVWERIGLDLNLDGNNGEPLGLNESVENWRDGRPQCVRQAYDLERIELLLDTTVHQVLVKNNNGERRAVGV